MWLILVAVLAMPTACDYAWSDELDTIIREEAARAGTPLDLAYTFIAAESGFNPDQVTAEAAGGYSYGLLQLYDHGQGAGYLPAVLLDPRLNLQIGLPYITAAHQATWSPTIAPFEFIYLISARSGHPGQVVRTDPRILRIARIWSCFFPAAGIIGPDGAPGSNVNLMSILGALTGVPLLVLFSPAMVIFAAASLFNLVQMLGSVTFLNPIPHSLHPSGLMQVWDPMRLPHRIITPWKYPIQAARRPPRHRPPRSPGAS